MATRWGVWAVGLCTAVLTGCVGITDPATNVGQTTARLNAHGRTDDYPAHFYFRYANQEADLPTAAAQRTPTRSVPANRPDNGEFGYFGENVTGLSPGRVYFFELCGGDDKPGAPDWCGGRQRFFTSPSSTQDSVRGTVYSGFGPYFNTLVFDAASGPQGQNADGWISVWYRGWYVIYDGRVTCLAVDGNRAAVGMVGTAYDGEDRPFSALYTLTDDGPEPTIGAVTESPPNCASASFDDQDPVLGGGVAVTDVP